MKKIILVEADPSYQSYWNHMIEGVEVILCIDPDDFSQRFREPADLEEVLAIVLDFRFYLYTAFSKGVIPYIRTKLNYKRRVFSWSLEIYLPRAYREQCDKILPKNITKWDEVRRLILSQSF